MVQGRARRLGWREGALPGARPRQLARLDGDKLEQVLEIVGQILGFYRSRRAMHSLLAWVHSAGQQGHALRSGRRL